MTTPKMPPPSLWMPLVKAAIAEDLGGVGDLTTKFFVPAKARLRGRIVVKQDGVICGLALAAAVFKAVSKRIKTKLLVKDGDKLRKGSVVMTVTGGREILTAERAALNFLQRMSGVATLTSFYTAAVAGTRAKILDTRKTLPGWRALDKYAVACGGGVNHRMGLYDAVLLKDNHWAMGADIAAGVAAVRKRHHVPIGIEAAGLAQVKRALACRPDVILLDNMSPPLLAQAIALIRRSAPKVKIEISGGVSLDNVRALARLGPDRISIGRLTHSAPALDISLEIP